MGVAPRLRQDETASLETCLSGVSPAPAQSAAVEPTQTDLHPCLFEIGGAFLPSTLVLPA
jgi:hypothetical protein